jgi:hypothetical protein
MEPRGTLFMIKIQSLLILILLAGCGEDVSSNRRLGENTTPDRTTPELGSEGSDFLHSHIHREKGSTVLTYAEEIRKTLANDLPATLYRLIPLIEKDDEGSSQNVITLDEIGRPNTDCGTGTFSGIDARITDCFQKNAEKALWEGVRYGASGEGTWKLISRNSSKEIWLDAETGMVWSYLIPSSMNWCKASGNSESLTPTTTVDCSTLGAQVSACVGASLSEMADQVKWRLPTRNDYLQADLNGLRFVLNRENNPGLWTATIRGTSSGRSEAWIYSSKEGTLLSDKLENEKQVRCIGVPVR